MSVSTRAPAATISTRGTVTRATQPGAVSACPERSSPDAMNPSSHRRVRAGTVPAPGRHLAGPGGRRPAARTPPAPPGSRARAASSAIVSRTAVKPERPRLDHTDLQQPGAGPRILRKPRRDVLLTGGLDHVQGLLAVADRAAQDQEAVVDQPVHEGRVLAPAVMDGLV